MTQTNQNTDQADGIWQRSMSQPTQRVLRVHKIREMRPGRKMSSPHPERIGTPGDHHDYHHGGHVHDAESFLAGLGDTFNVLPPEIDGDYGGKERSRPVHVQDETGVGITQKL